MSPRLPRLLARTPQVAEYVGQDRVLWSRRATLYQSATPEGQRTRLGSVPRPPIRRLVGLIRPGQRLLREQFYNVIPVGDGLFFTYGNEIGVLRPGGRVDFVRGRARNARVLRDGVGVGPDGSLYFGDYHDNAERDEVPVYRLRPGALEVERAHTFKAGEIRHVHSVSWDPTLAALVVACGDVGAECKLVVLPVDGGEPYQLGGGDEQWRAISPQFTRSAIDFGTDAQFQQNHLYRFDRASGQLHPLAEVNGPVFYATRCRAGFVFATSAEGCPSQTSDEAILYLVRSDSTVSVVARFDKDALPTKLFQFGLVYFPTLHADFTFDGELLGVRLRAPRAGRPSALHPRRHVTSSKASAA